MASAKVLSGGGHGLERGMLAMVDVGSVREGEAWPRVEAATVNRMPNCYVFLPWVKGVWASRRWTTHSTERLRSRGGYLRGKKGSSVFWMEGQTGRSGVAVSDPRNQLGEAP